MTKEAERDENTAPVEETTAEENSDKIEVEIRNSKNKAEGSSETAESEEKPLTPEEKTAAEIAELKEKLNAAEDKYLRLAAEFDNFRKRTARQYDEMVKAANQNLISDLLEVVDNFQRALEVESTGSDGDSLRKGIELVYQSLFGILEKQGLAPIEAIGKEFDPNVHEAMMQTPSEEYAEGIVARELTKGYTLNGKVVRHSRVAVSTGPPDDENK
ncbi:MAG: nucleotide exchange factor GrpE [candidate division Zixibacteria bacterium]|nr:nucleotide exchange factor GrpE [candidate division Zixibacteria bacterium]